MRNYPTNPFKDLVLDEEEKEINDAIEAGRVRVVPNVRREIRRAEQAAKYTLSKNKNINLRLSHADLLRIRAKAIAEGIPYQTLIGSILHKYAVQAS